jgi:hypothetical protein
LGSDQFVDSLPLVPIPGRLQQFTPRRDVRSTTQQGTPLALRHAAPDAELDSVVESVS